MKYRHPENSVSGEGLRLALIRREQSMAKIACPPGADDLTDAEALALNNTNREKERRHEQTYADDD